MEEKDLVNPENNPETDAQSTVAVSDEKKPELNEELNINQNADQNADQNVEQDTVQAPEGDAEVTPDGDSCDTFDEPEPVKKKLPKICFVFYGMAVVSAIIEIVCILSQSFADFFNTNIASITRTGMAWLTAWIPFSLGEMVVILIPVIIVGMIIIAGRLYSDSWHNVGIFCLEMLSLISLFFVCYVFSLGTGYQGATLDEKLEIDREKVTAEELKYTADIMIDKLEELTPEIMYGNDGFSVMPYNYSEMVSKLLDAYDVICEDYTFIKNFRGPVKTVMLSEPWTYTHITGVYSYFTGEANININMPDYTIPYTAAHELAHQRGIAREDEANFIAFLVCIASDDPYIQYSGYANMYEYLANPLYSASADSYWECYASLPSEVRSEEHAYSAFFAKYRETVVSTVSNAVNDTYLKLNGTEGAKSYGMVVDLAVAWYRK